MKSTGTKQTTRWSEIASALAVTRSIFWFIALGAASGLIAFAQAPKNSGSALRPGSSREPGKQVYDAHCAACHGSNGDGNGPASVWLFPKPRNFNSGLFKIQSTPAGSLPTDDDLFQTVTRGMPGSSMPSFTYLSEAQRRAAVQYVKWLAADVDASPRAQFHLSLPGESV